MAVTQNPAFPLKLDYEISGPAAGFYAAQQLGNFDEDRGRANRDNDLAYQTAQLRYDEALKDTPVNAAKRETELADADFIKQNRELIETEKIAKARASVSESEWKMASNRAEAVNSLAHMIPDPSKHENDDPVAQAQWAAFAKSAREAGVTGVPPAYSKAAAAEYMQKAQQAASVIKFNQEEAKRRAKHKDDVEIENIRATSRVSAANATATNRGDLQPGETQAVRTVRKAIETETPIDPTTFTRAIIAQNTLTLPKDPESSKGAIANRAQLMERALLEAKNAKSQVWTDAAKSVGMPLTSTAIDVAYAIAEKKANASRVSDVLNAFAGARIQIAKDKVVGVNHPAVRQMAEKIIAGEIPDSAPAAATAAPGQPAPAGEAQVILRFPDGSLKQGPASKVPNPLPKGVTVVGPAPEGAATVPNDVPGMPTGLPNTQPAPKPAGVITQ